METRIGSRRKVCIELETPCMYVAGEHTETLVSPGHVCNYCHGSGEVLGEDSEGESVIGVCPVCEGSGEMDAEVTITWRPSGLVSSKRGSVALWASVE